MIRPSLAAPTVASGRPSSTASSAILPPRSGSGAGMCGFTGGSEGFVGVASPAFTIGMRAADLVWPVGGGTIGDVSTTFPSGRLRGHELLSAVAEGTAGAVGDEFLRCLAQH